MGYLEEIFLRQETKFSTLRDEGNILDWLRRDKTGKIARRATSGLRSLAGTYAEPFQVQDSVEEAADLPELRVLKRRMDALPSELRRPETIEAIDTKIDVLTEEQRITAEITEFRERVEELKSLPREELRDLFKETPDPEERALARVALGEAQPKTLGGLISGESRRKNIAIRQLFP
jgi:hypothetical protein